MMEPNSFLEFVLDQLADLEAVQSRAMFGGHGLYQAGNFFGIVYGDVLYFKTDAATRPDYTRRGMGTFRPNPKQTLKTYYEVPAEILENHSKLTAWACRAVACQAQV